MSTGQTTICKQSLQAQESDAQHLVRWNKRSGSTSRQQRGCMTISWKHTGWFAAVSINVLPCLNHFPRMGKMVQRYRLNIPRYEDTFEEEGDLMAERVKLKRELLRLEEEMEGYLKEQGYDS